MTGANSPGSSLPRAWCSRANSELGELPLKVGGRDGEDPKIGVVHAGQIEHGVVEERQRHAEYPHTMAGEAPIVPVTTGAFAVGGKSTVTFACLAAGMGFLGDDAIAVEDGRGSTIHAVAKVSEATLGQYPALEAASERFDDPETDERAVRLGGSVASAIESAHIAAIAFPRLADSDPSSVRPLVAGRAVIELWPCALSAEAWRLGDAFTAVSALAASVPAFVLEVGRDPAGIAEAIDGIL